MSEECLKPACTKPVFQSPALCMYGGMQILLIPAREYCKIKVVLSYIAKLKFSWPT